MLHRISWAYPLLVVLGSAGVMLFAEEPQGEGGAAPEAVSDPEFSKPASAAEFEKAKGLFADGKYREAEIIFKKLKTDAKSKDDKDKVDQWAQGVAGAILLEKLKPMEKQGKLLVYDEVQKHFLRYGSTPAGGLYQQYLKSLDSEIFETVEDFDTQSPAYSEKYGKTFHNDPKVSLDGTQYLRWVSPKDRKGSVLKISGPAKVPHDWSTYSAIEFWVNAVVPPRAPEAVIMSGEPEEAAAKKAPAKKKPATAAREDCLHATVPMPASGGQWKLIRMPLAEFQVSGGGTLSEVQSFRIQIAAGIQFDIYIDRVRLVRKETAAPKGATPPAQPKATGKTTKKK